MRAMAAKFYAHTPTPAAAKAAMRSAAAARTGKPAEAAPVQARSLLSSARSPAEPSVPQHRHPPGVADFGRRLFERQRPPEPERPVGLTTAAGLATAHAVKLALPRPVRRVAPKPGMSPEDLLIAFQLGRVKANDPTHGARIRAMLRTVGGLATAKT